MSHQTVAQKRAKHALNIVCGVGDKPGFKGKSATSQKKINSYIAGFGPMILMNGFGQACAFYLANNEEEHQDVYDAIAQWLTSSDRPYAGERDLMQAIVNSDVTSYRLAQTEALAYLDWLKKFAKAFLKDEKESNEEGESDANATQ